MGSEEQRETVLENGLKLIQNQDTDAYKINYGAHKVGISAGEMVNYYSEWANKGTYEQDLCPGRYNGPKIATQFVSRYLGNNTDALILDAAAGTGFLGEELSHAGFKNLHALEPSRGMINIAEGKKVYSHIVCDFLGTNQTEIKDDIYDVLTISGGMGEGHIPCLGLVEMIRVVKPGGLIIIVMRKEYLTSVFEYKDRLEPMINAFEAEGLWKKESRTEVENYSFGKQGVVYVYRVNTAGSVPKEQV